MKKYEYLVDFIDEYVQNIHHRLNELGEQGWELVTMVVIKEYYFKLIFKRVKK